MTPRAIEGTALGFPAPVHQDVWSKNVDPVLPVDGVLMTMLAHDQGMPQFVGIERPVAARYVSSHVVGFDLGSYGSPEAERAMIAGRESGALVQELARIFLNPRELPA